VSFASLSAAARAVLRAADPVAKVGLSVAVARDWRSGAIGDIGHAAPPDRPARPDRPALRRPGDMARRNRGRRGRVAMLHAIAHIELNAIDLAWDMVARFAGTVADRAFADDWVSVAVEEARHFELLCRRLAAFDAAYGDLPAHDGLWQAAQATADDVLARLAVVPLVLEARGLDVTPGIIEGFERAGDTDSAAVLRRIYQDEIGHVATGQRWFEAICQRRGLAPTPTWQSLVRDRFAGPLKPPFNTAARAQAGLPESLYQPLAKA